VEDYIAIHYDQTGNIYLERTEASDWGEAIDSMERNDTNIIVMLKSTFDRLRTMELPDMGQMVLVGKGGHVGPGEKDNTG
jgi:hypothetical protein